MSEKFNIEKIKSSPETEGVRFVQSLNGMLPPGGEVVQQFTYCGNGDQLAWVRSHCREFKLECKRNRFVLADDTANPDSEEWTIRTETHHENGSSAYEYPFQGEGEVEVDRERGMVIYQVPEKDERVVLKVLDSKKFAAFEKALMG